MKRALRLTLLLLGLSYLGACIYMYSAQRALIFKPSRQVDPIEEVFPGAQAFSVKTDDAEQLQLWYRAADQNQPTLVYLHGNAGNLSTRKRLIEVLSADGRGLVIFSWRGYGESTGEPSEQGLYRDARTVFEWLEQQGLPSSELFLYGESLGSGVAVQLATEREFAGIILAAPYTSLANMAKTQYPWLPVDLLLEHRFDSLSKITQVTEPLVILHSQDDRVIPFELGKQLSIAANEPKHFMNFNDRGHTGFTQSDTDRAIDWLSGYSKVEQVAQ